MIEWAYAAPAWQPLGLLLLVSAIVMGGCEFAARRRAQQYRGRHRLRRQPLLGRGGRVPTLRRRPDETKEPM